MRADEQNSHLVFLDKVANVVEHVSGEVDHPEAVARVRVRAIVALRHDVVLVVAVHLLNLGEELGVRPVHHDLLVCAFVRLFVCRWSTLYLFVENTYTYIYIY